MADRKTLREAVIVAAARTPVGRAKKGVLKNVRPETLGAIVVKELIRRTPGLDPTDIDDVVLGCAFPEGEQGMNLARIVAFKAGLPISVCGVTVNRFCSSGLQTISQAAERIMVGAADVMIAGGVESMSVVPMGGNKLAPDPELAAERPEIYTGMGNTAEIVADEFKVTRPEMDAFAVRSNTRALIAIKEGKFREEIVPVPYVDDKGVEQLHDTDEGPRESTVEGLGALKPAFKMNGSVTAANSSQMNDAAAGVMLMSLEKAQALGLTPLAYYRGFQVAGVRPEVMGIGPAVAIPKLLKHVGMTVDQIDLFEINEAFASQAIYCTRELGVPDEKLNVNGGAIALGHPLGCTGAKLTVQLVHEMKRRGARYGIVSMCIGGGMGAAGLFERA
jgi:acetyl-CoA acyltransferase